jgi:3-oxoacyl-[acyl-carrier protein] reductase
VPLRHSNAGPDLEGLVALVTGGGRGMGRAIACRLAAHGAQVVAAARTGTELAETSRLSGRIIGLTCDVSDAAAVASLFSEVDERYGRLDLLICSHGIYPGVRALTDIPLDEYQRTIGINFTGTFLCAQHAARAMLAGGAGGSIVAISSMNALASQYGAADYDASKAAVHGLVRACAVELAPSGISVNVIAPGWNGRRCPRRNSRSSKE